MPRSPTTEAFVGAGGTYGPRTGRTGLPDQFHAGWDFRGSLGEPVYAAAGGVVETTVSNDGEVGSILSPVPPSRAFRGYGNVVVVKHDDGTWASYNHLATIKVRPGQRLLEGALIGTVGNTNNGQFPGMGSHLHFEVRQAPPRGGSPFPGPYRVYNIDPAAWFARYGLVRERGQLVRLAGSDAYEPPLAVWWFGPFFKRDMPAWVKALGFGMGLVIGATTVYWFQRK